jgi:hypothetical protein
MMTKAEIQQHLKKILVAIEDGEDEWDIRDYILSLLLQIDK